MGYYFESDPPDWNTEPESWELEPEFAPLEQVYQEWGWMQ